jgi:2,3,4,5-tetrahydropyridine-2-carboxylate N-succinyltransferase
MNSLQTIIEQAWENRALLQEETTTKAIREVIELLDVNYELLNQKETHGK